MNFLSEKDPKKRSKPGLFWGPEIPREINKGQTEFGQYIIQSWTMEDEFDQRKSIRVSLLLTRKIVTACCSPTVQPCDIKLQGKVFDNCFWKTSLMSRKNILACFTARRTRPEISTRASVSCRVSCLVNCSPASTAGLASRTAETVMEVYVTSR